MQSRACNVFNYSTSDIGGFVNTGKEITPVAFIRQSYSTRLWHVFADLKAYLALLVGLSVPVLATHTVITPNDISYDERGQGFNGFRVYLSSPTHTNSGGRGELGWEENINGRHWGYYAAIGNYVDGFISSSQYRSLTSRGYKVTLSQNDRNGDFIGNRNRSDNWGADVHLVTHSNAAGGNYFLAMVDDATNTASDLTLRAELAARVGPAVPGTEIESTDNSPFTGNLGELRAVAPYNVYVELFFHDTQSHVDWFGSGDDWGRSVKNDPWRYGWAIDRTLGYPRS